MHCPPQTTHKEEPPLLLITTPDPYALSGHGHCEAGAPGRDIVCAAASCLLDAYAARLQELDIPLRLRQGPGLLEIRPRHIPRRLRRDVAAARATVLTGLTRLASCYPTRVKVIVTG